MKLITPSKFSSSTVKKGFTLIELLVVIAIIAILAAVLFPVFGRARENGRRASCQSNLKQIGLGLAQYSQDYDERVVSAQFFVAARPLESSTWVRQSYAYVKSTQIYQCPSDKETAPADGAAQYWGREAPFFPTPPHISYVYNQAFFENNADGSLSGVMLAKIVSPTTTVAATDGGSAPVSGKDDADWIPKPKSWILDQSRATQVQNTTSASYFNTTYAGPSNRHLETTNVLFVDGHVKALRRKSWYPNVTDLGQKPNSAPGVGQLGYSYCLDISQGCPI